jgi:hypothetical protein
MREAWKEMVPLVKDPGDQAFRDLSGWEDMIPMLT